MDSLPTIYLNASLHCGHTYTLERIEHAKQSEIDQNFIWWTKILNNPKNHDDRLYCKICNNHITYSKQVILSDCEEVESPQPIANKNTPRTYTCCYLEGESILALVDGGASTSCVDQRWVKKKGLPIEPRTGTIGQFAEGYDVPRIGIVSGLRLQNGERTLRVNLEVMNINNEELVIGVDLFESLHFRIIGVP